MRFFVNDEDQEGSHHTAESSRRPWMHMTDEERKAHRKATRIRGGRIVQQKRLAVALGAIAENTPADRVLSLDEKGKGKGMSNKRSWKK